MKWGKAAMGVFLGSLDLGSFWEMSMGGFITVHRDSVGAVQNLESELFLIDVLGITSSWPQFPRLNAPSFKLTWLMYRSETKLSPLSTVQ